LVLMEGQPIEDFDRLCDANYAMKKPELGCACKYTSLCELDRHYPVACWYCSRYCCAHSVPKPSVFKTRGFNGESNMGKLTMQLVDFMTNECGWSLVLCNGTNLGWYGDIREQQVKFAAPSALNLIAPHIMIELRAVGYIEVNGRDTDGVYELLRTWLSKHWKAESIKADPDYCDLKFSCREFKRRGFEGENNMGLCTMQLVDYLTLQCSWTLVACNGGNFGMRGDWREQQLVFRKDEHVQHGGDNVMVELRDVLNSGYIEVNGIETSPSIREPLHDFITTKWRCKDFDWHGREPFCEKKYTTPAHFYYREPKLVNNLGKRTIELATFMASQGWLLKLCNGGAITHMRGLGNRINARSIHFLAGTEFQGQINREQQVKFTKARPGEKSDGSYLMIELRAVPRDPGVENIPWCIGPRCGCESDKHERESKDWEWSLQTPNRRLTRREEVRNWLRSDYRVAQVNMYKGDMDPDSAMYPSYQEPQWRTAARYVGSPCGIFEGLIEVNGPDTNNIYKHLEYFITTQMRGKRLQARRDYCDALFTCDVFRMKRVPFPATNPEVDGYYLGENNIGIYTMRLCDYLVDHLGDWDLVVCNGSALERAWKVDRDRMVSVVSREQQLVFRHRGARRNVFMAAQPTATGPPLGRPPLQAPDYWDPATREGRVPHKLVPAAPQEMAWLQELLDGTFKHKTTRDGRGRRLAKRFVAVQALRSEHPALWDRYAQRRTQVAEERRSAPPGCLVAPNTANLAEGLTGRCRDDEGRNPANEALLFHGTNPAGALSILGTSFKIDAAGLAAGTMFGPGVYLAECSTKSDEYAQDDPEGANKGLFAMLLCRAVVGKPFVVEEPGNYATQVTSGEFDCVLGDREKAVGTYREFIFFHEASIYPEYVLFYRRDDEDGLSTRATTTCKFWARGYCKYGDKCRFAHAHSAPGAATTAAAGSTVTVVPAPTAIGAPTQHVMKPP